MEFQQNMEKSVVELYCKRPLFSLKKMTLLRITTTLCNNRQLLGLIMKCKHQEEFVFKLCTRRGPEWAAVQKMANELVSQICNCIKLRKMIMEFLWPVSHTMVCWKFKYAPFIENQFIWYFHWTDQGRINNRRTVQLLIGNENIPVRKRFVLACKACLSDEIQELWREMSNDDKIYFETELNERTDQLAIFWFRTMRGTDNVPGLLINNACTFAVDKGLLDALKFLFSLVSNKERTKLAFEYTLKYYLRICEDGYHDADELEMGYFLFFELRHDSRYFISSYYHPLKLTLLLHFAERDHFFNALEESLQSALREEDKLWFQICAFLGIMFNQYHSEIIQDDDFRKIFVYILRAIPVSLKDKIISLDDFGTQFLCLLIRDNFPFLLRKGAFKKIEALTSLDSKPSTAVAQFGFHRDKWELLHFLIEEGIVSIPMLKKNKPVLILELKIRRSNKAAWNRILQFVRNVGRIKPAEKTIK